MLISCKCLNFVASSNTSRSASSGNIHQVDKSIQSTTNGSASDSNASSDENQCNDALIAEVIYAFVQRYPRNCVFYSQCMELLKQATGPLAELSVTIHQRDLICMLPCNSWVIHICINCNTALCCKHTSNAIYLINSNLLVTSEELAHRKADKSFSETFGILIMNHQLQQIDENPFTNRSNKSKNRLRSLTQNLQLRLQKEIADTDERIHRYTEQQFALLKSFREKSEQEYQILVSLVNQVPEQIIDAMGAASNAASVPTTPTTLTKIVIGGGSATSNSSASAMDSNTQLNAQNVFTFNNKKVTTFDTPPATPDSTPMSVGNSPTFNRQQQTSIGAIGNNRFPIGNGTFYVNSSNSNGGSGMDDGDCLFELEGVESYSMLQRASLPLNMSDVEESAEDAEDALAELEAAIPIPGSHSRKQNANHFAKSLPIAIANSVNESTIVTDSDDDILDDNVDIAASIKALAKSVHGDAVFGDLPRPRLRTQI